MDSSYAKTAVASVLAGVIGLASYGVVRETQTIGEGKIVMATGSSSTTSSRKATGASWSATVSSSKCSVSPRALPR